MVRLESIYKFYRIERLKKVVLNDVSFNFETGRSYGILGVNGAGKSTLMRVLAGTELPNRGRVRRSVRVSWPLGFGGGLAPGMTGRENIKFVARAYGENVSQVVDFVVDFAEIGPYIDAPVKTYSSGMIQRVAYGLSMAINFECYLIDETMAVGDARFIRKCKFEFDKRKAFSDIIMVTHDVGAIKEYCQHALVLAGAKLHFFANVDDAIETYRQLNM